MHRQFFIALAAAALLFLAAVLLLPTLFARSGSVRDASVAFLTVSNCWFDKRHPGRYAAFSLTNNTPCRIGYYAESIEVRTEHGWQATALQCTPSNWIRFGAIMERGQSSVFYVPPPTSNAAWRLRI